MRKVLSVLITICLVVSLFSGAIGHVPTAAATSASMLISEVATGSSAVATDEYIELFNASGSPVDLNGWFLKYCGGAAGGTGVTPAWVINVSWSVSTPVPAYGHYLIKGSGYGGASDAVLGAGISEIGAASIWNGATQVDALGWGLMTGHLERAEGGTPVAATGLTRGQVIERKPGYPNWNGQDTDNNIADFTVSASSDGSARHPQTLADAITPPAGSLSVPGSPTGLAATDGLGQISLAWSAPANDGGAGTVGYNVYRAADASMSGMTILNNSLVATASYVDGGLGAGDHYWYTVTAQNSIGAGAACSAVEGWTFDVPPAVVSTVAVEGDGRVDLTWNASVGDPQHLSVVSYNVWRGTSAGEEDIVTPINGTPVSGLSFSDTTAVNDTTYFYRVTAVNEVGQTGVLSGNEVTATPHILITAPIITNLVPADKALIANVRPHISAEYGDTGSAIDDTSVTLLVDGIDVTSQAVITASSVSYVPASDLTKSTHSVQLDVANLAATPVSTRAVWTFTVGDYNIYFGGMHSHTNLSDGTGTPQQAYDSAKAAGADFMAVTDHSNWFDGDSTTVAADLAGGPSTEWATLKAAADANNVPGTFVGIAGFEMTWSGGPGHINTFNTVGYDTRTHSAMTLTAYYAQLAQYPQSISQLNHPGTTFGTFDDFGHWTAEADAVVDLVEVGNGEGPVHQAGYFPSYQYYQMALDKGWHVAPSNNQDNHKGNWMFSNDARTVVLAPELTRDAIFEAIRQKRVYATEDKDLQVTYFLNGAVMGSSLNNPSTLDFSITFSDAQTTDITTKVSIIANGGVVVASTTPNASQGTWNFSLPNDPYSFYYVRIDQADTDVAVTAPVWTGDVVKVGVSKVEVSQDPQIVNTPVDFTATAYNNGSTSVDNATMEFFKDSIAPENKLGEVAVPSIAASGMTTAKITWTPSTAGTWTIYARLTALVDAQVKTFSASTSFTAANPADVTKVVIDGGHLNAYVTGYYAGNMKTLTALIKTKKFMPVTTAVGHELTAADLLYAKLLILCDPQSKPLPPKNYTAAEIQVIKDFVAAGGSLILTSRADYDEASVKADLTAHSAYQGNVVLDAIGSNLRLNDDEVIDNTSNGGQNYRLYFDDYTGTTYHLTDNIPVGETYSFYSGCSVILKSGGSDAQVDWLVKGHTTTASLDSDLANDATPVAQG
ncbi:MAG TPA: CehA/McbA family metallohydrolase, partial [Candidatus Deferrimicrobium sp.]|nr:CehA/McbA family metallohydrolase [Candidatus Deferrimicrobium sp.]